MKKINLRELYPDAYTTDFFVNVTEDVLETIRASERAEAAYERKMYRYKAQYSLDCENGIENTVLTKPQTPEMVLEEKQLQKQVYETNLKVIQDIMGHADITTTMNIYAEATKEKKQEAMANLNGKIKIM